MADTVTTRVLVNDATDYVVRSINESDGTGQANVVLVDYSALDPAAGGDLVLVRAHFACFGMAVKLSWDATADVVAAILAGTGTIDSGTVGRALEQLGAGKTGDLFVSTVGAGAGDSYDVTLELIKRAS